MSVYTITSENLKNTTDEHSIVLVYVWAEWCAPCVQFSPIFERISRKHKDVFFGKIDAESRGTLVEDLKIKALPTLMVFRDDTLLYRQVGPLSASDLNRLVDQVKRFDEPDDDSFSTARNDPGETWADWLRTVLDATTLAQVPRLQGDMA